MHLTLLLAVLSFPVPLENVSVPACRTARPGSRGRTPIAPPRTPRVPVDRHDLPPCTIAL